MCENLHLHIAHLFVHRQKSLCKQSAHQRKNTPLVHVIKTALYAPVNEPTDAVCLRVKTVHIHPPPTVNKSTSPPRTFFRFAGWWQRGRDIILLLKTNRAASNNTSSNCWQKKPDDSWRSDSKTLSHFQPEMHILFYRSVHEVVSARFLCFWILFLPAQFSRATVHDYHHHHHQARLCLHRHVVLQSRRVSNQ